MNPQKDDGEGFPLDYFSPHANSGDVSMMKSQ